MANRKISDLTALTATATGDLLPIVDISEAGAADQNKKITVENLFKGIPGNVGIGTSSPSGALDVRTAASTFQAFIGTNSGTSANDAGIVFQSTPSATAASRSCVLYFDANGANGSGGDYFYISNTGDHVASLWNQGNGPIVFGRSSTESLRIDSSGRLLVGTSTVTGNSAYSTAEFIKNTFSEITIGRNTSTIIGEDGVGQILFNSYAGNVWQPHASITCVADANGGSGDKPGRLVFSTTADGAASPTERMRIGQNGFFRATTDGSYTGTDGLSHAFRTTGANWVAQFVNDQATAANNYGIVVKYQSSAPNGTGNSFILCGDNAADRFQARSNGGLANYQANNVNLSDRNTKKDISPAVDTWDCIKEWEIVNYRYKDQSDDADLNLGVIAQQVAESCPEVVTIFQGAKEATDDVPAQEERLGVKEQQMYWMAIKALQEAQVRIETLEARLTAAGIA